MSFAAMHDEYLMPPNEGPEPVDMATEVFEEAVYEAVMALSRGIEECERQLDEYGCDQDMARARAKRMQLFIHILENGPGGTVKGRVS